MIVLLVLTDFLYSNFNAFQLDNGFFFHNNCVEGFNGNFKTRTKSRSNAIGAMPLKVGRLVKELKQYNNCRAREFLLKRQRKFRNQSKEHKEGWARKSKLQQTKGHFFQNRSLMKVQKTNLKPTKMKSGKYTSKRFKFSEIWFELCLFI